MEEGKQTIKAERNAFSLKEKSKEPAKTDNKKLVVYFAGETTKRATKRDREGGTRRNGHENQNQFEANVHSDSASSLLAASADGTARLMEKRTEREWHDTHLWLLLGMKLEKFYNYWVRSLSPTHSKINFSF